MTKAYSALTLCRNALKVSDEELAELEDAARKQTEFLSPLRMATTARQNALGRHNLSVLAKVRELRETIKGGETLVTPNV